MDKFVLLSTILENSKFHIPTFSQESTMRLGSCPFFLLDEVEPSLDYMNHKSMQSFLKDVADNKQLIMITHLRSTIALADTLHGVRTRWDGSSFMKFYFVMNL